MSLTRENAAQKLTNLAKQYGGGEYVRWAEQALQAGDYAKAIYWSTAELRTNLGKDAAEKLIAAQWEA